MTGHLVIAGLGYSGAAIAAAARDAGMNVTATARNPAGKQAPDGITLIPFDDAGDAIAAATHLVITASPTEAGDPVLIRHHAALQAAQNLRWIGYCSTTGVYGDHAGGAVDESTPPNPGTDRTKRRVTAERAWCEQARHRAVDILRLAGIYGPARSVFDDLSAGVARRIDKPDHKFSRIHVEDIAHGTLAAIATATSGVRILNFSDDEPAASAVVIAYAATLLGIAPPPLIPFDDAKRSMSPMALSFWSENRVVLNRQTKTQLNLAWRYPTYREGLAAIMDHQSRATNS
ncbi:SDR family NAD(P)-dependent oxidoreductase [Acidiphilium sp.]|uniref:SDR family NAD(P)-dependent oxidoreductase n=1 Tax=Acidiphilium sp. TaxID=527 RepID=UPI003D0570AC